MGRTQRLAQPLEFGKYQLVARLARGRMGEVYKAKSRGVEGFEKILVLKVIDVSLSAIPGLMDSLIEEAKRSVALSHANIAQVYDVGQDESQGAFYLAVEHVDGIDLGRTLQGLAQSGRTMPEGFAVLIASEIAKALDYAHRRKDFQFNDLNILHRAVSPHNVMLSFDGEVKLTDFGISRALELVPSTQIQDHNRRYAYAAPEVARGDALTRASDLFGLGLVLYEMLSGQHPYGPLQGRDPAHLRQLAMDGRIVPLQELVALPEPLLRIVNALVQPDPDRRAASAGDVYEDLVGYLYGNNLPADAREMGALVVEMHELERRTAPAQETQRVDLDEVNEPEPMVLPAVPALRPLEAPARLRPGGLDENTTDLNPSRVRASLAVAAPAPPAPPVAAAPVVTPAAVPVVATSPIPPDFANRLGHAAQGRGQVLVLGGRHGRQRHALGRLLAQGPAGDAAAGVIALRANLDDRLRPFGLGSALIAQLLGQRAPHTPEEALSLVQALIAIAAPADGLEALLVLWHPQAAADPRAGLAPSLRQGLADLVIAVARAASLSAPKVVVLDHVERADELSRAALAALVAAAPTMGIVLLVGADDDDWVASHLSSPDQLLGSFALSQDEPAGWQDCARAGDPALDVLALLALSDMPLGRAALGAILPAWDGPKLTGCLEQLVRLGALEELGTQDGPEGQHAWTPARPSLLNWVAKSVHPEHLEALARDMAGALGGPVARSPFHPAAPPRMRCLFLGREAQAAVRAALAHGQWLEQLGCPAIAALTYGDALRLLAQSPTQGAASAEISLCLAQARASSAAGQSGEARQALERAKALGAARTSRPAGVTLALMQGRLALAEGGGLEARQIFAWAHAEATELGDASLLSASQLALAHYHERHGQWREAQAAIASALHLASLHGFRSATAGSAELLELRAATERIMAACQMPPTALREWPELTHHIASTP